MVVRSDEPEDDIEPELVAEPVVRPKKKKKEEAPVVEDEDALSAVIEKWGSDDA